MEYFCYVLKIEDTSFEMPELIYFVYIYAKLHTSYQENWKRKWGSIILSHSRFIYESKYNYQFIIYCQD